MNMTVGALLWWFGLDGSDVLVLLLVGVPLLFLVGAVVDGLVARRWPGPGLGWTDPDEVAPHCYPGHETEVTVELPPALPRPTGTLCGPVVPDPSETIVMHVRSGDRPC